MTIFAGSRYSTASIILAPQPNGKSLPTVFASKRSLIAKFVYYRVGIGDRFDTIAARFLGDPLKWWMIADYNPQIFYPEELQPGSILRIPSP